MRKIQGALLDVDGTLLDSNEAHVSAWVEALREQGVEIAPERMRHLIGMGADNLLPTLGLSDQKGPGKLAKEKHDALFSEALPTLKPIRGGRALVMRLRDEGVARIIVTSSRKDELHRLLKQAKVDDLIEATVAGEDAPATKPAPDLVAAAIGRSGLPAESLVMLGDTPYDVSAAEKMGVRTVAVRSGGFSDEELAGAAVIYDDAADLLAHFETSPFRR